MARRKPTSSGWVWLVVIGMGANLLSQARGSAVLIYIGIAAAIGGGLWFAVKQAKKGSASKVTSASPAALSIDVTPCAPTPREGRASKRRQAEPVGFNLNVSDLDEPPPARESSGQQVRWHGPGEIVAIGDLRLPGGMLYVGKPGQVNGQPDPAVFDPSKPRQGRPGGSINLPYYPNPSLVTAEQRKAYLDWLAGGRREDIEVGYAFMFFYGLERRVIRETEQARAELPAIRSEVQRLLRIYAPEGAGSRSFRRYATGFLDVIAACEYRDDAPLPPTPPEGSPTNVQLLIGVGRYVEAGMKVPPQWALAWFRALGQLGPCARRIPELFDRAFIHEFRRAYGDGLTVRAGRSRLGVTYKPASMAMPAPVTYALDLPNVAISVAVTKDLLAIAESCEAQLAKTSRIAKADRSAVNSPEAVIQMPVHLWPEERVAVLGKIAVDVGKGIRPYPLKELLSLFGLPHAAPRKMLLGIQDALATCGLAVEPEIPKLGKFPQGDDQLVIFAVTLGEPTSLATPSGQAAGVMLDLGFSVAMADGNTGAGEMMLLMRQIDSWPNLNASQRTRLRAKLRRSILQPPNLRAVYSSVSGLPEAIRKAVGHLLTTLAHVDGEPGAEEIKKIERAYKAMGLDQAEVYRNLHEAGARKPTPAAKPAAPGAGPVVPKPTAPPERVPSSGPVQLDAVRIAQIQAETDEVARLLANVFEEEAAAHPQPAAAIEEEADEGANDSSAAPEATLLGLDAEHSTFLRQILTRPSWTRAELGDVAADLDLMLDGALERINDAAFENYNEALLEGDDPVEVRQDLMEAQAA